MEDKYTNLDEELITIKNEVDGLLRPEASQ